MFQTTVNRATGGMNSLLMRYDLVEFLPLPPISGGSRLPKGCSTLPPSTMEDTLVSYSLSMLSSCVDEAIFSDVAKTNNKAEVYVPAHHACMGVPFSPSMLPCGEGNAVEASLSDKYTVSELSRHVHVSVSCTHARITLRKPSPVSGLSVPLSEQNFLRN